MSLEGISRVGRSLARRRLGSAMVWASLLAAGATWLAAAGAALGHQIPHDASHCGPMLSIADDAEAIAGINPPPYDYHAVVVSGTVGEDRGIVDDGGTRIFQFHVEQWFGAPPAVETIGMNSGLPEMGSLQFEPGMRIVVLASLDQNGVLGESGCWPHALLGTPEGDALLAEARQFFGEPLIPEPGSRATSADATDPLQTLAIIAAGAVLLGLLVVGLLVVGFVRLVRHH